MNEDYKEIVESKDPLNFFPAGEMESNSDDEL